MILTVDNLNLIVRVSRGGGGHQSEMHNLTNVIALCPTSDEAGAEYTSLRLEFESLGPQPLSDDWEEQKKGSNKKANQIYVYPTLMTKRSRTWVVFPQPVSPLTTTTGLDLISLTLKIIYDVTL